MKNLNVQECLVNQSALNNRQPYDFAGDFGACAARDLRGTWA